MTVKRLQLDLAAACFFIASVVWGRRAVDAGSRHVTDDRPSCDDAAKQRSQSTPHRHPNNAPIQPKPIYSDAYYLHHAQQIRSALTPPSQSNFRVVCILLLQNGSVIVGTNDESTPNIAGSICAERAALLAYRMQFTRQPITSVFIVTDADTPIPPGTLCREYLDAHFATSPETRFVLQSCCETSTPWVVTLRELHPYPSLYSGMTAQEQLLMGQTIEPTIERLLSEFEISGLLFNDQILRLMDAAHRAALQDDRDALHPLRYGAAMAVRIHDKVEIIQASQMKALEYGSTQDAVCQLLAVLRERVQIWKRETMGQQFTAQQKRRQSFSAVQVLCLAQVDQFGIPHVPFAPARSMLVEHGLGHVRVVLTVEKSNDAQRGSLSVESVYASNLCPFVPDFCDESSKSETKEPLGWQGARTLGLRRLVHELLTVSNEQHLDDIAPRNGESSLEVWPFS